MEKGCERTLAAQRSSVEGDAVAHREDRNYKPGCCNQDQRRSIVVSPQHEGGNECNNARERQVRTGRDAYARNGRYFPNALSFFLDFREHRQAGKFFLVHFPCTSPGQSTGSSSEKLPRDLPGSV